MNQLNLRALYRVDPGAEKLLDVACHTVLYQYVNEDESWTKLEVEGVTMFYTRSSGPSPSIAILNRINEQDFVCFIEEIEGKVQREVEQNNNLIIFTIIRDGVEMILSLWFYKEDDMERFYHLIKSSKKEIKDKKDKFVKSKKAFLKNLLSAESPGSGGEEFEEEMHRPPAFIPAPSRIKPSSSPPHHPSRFISNNQNKLYHKEKMFDFIDEEITATSSLSIRKDDVNEIKNLLLKKKPLKEISEKKIKDSALIPGSKIIDVAPKKITLLKRPAQTTTSRLESEIEALRLEPTSNSLVTPVVPTELVPNLNKIVAAKSPPPLSDLVKLEGKKNYSSLPTSKPSLSASQDNVSPIVNANKSSSLVLNEGNKAMTMESQKSVTPLLKKSSSQPSPQLKHKELPSVVDLLGRIQAKQQQQQQKEAETEIESENNELTSSPPLAPVHKPISDIPLSSPPSPLFPQSSSSSLSSNSRENSSSNVKKENDKTIVNAEQHDSIIKFCDKIREINADNQEEFINKFMRRIFSDDQLQSLLYSLKLNK